jgi:acyl-CoA synthetase (NDP forming)
MKTNVDHQAIRRLFSNIQGRGRRYLYEYEVYDLIRHIGSESVPRFLVLPKDTELGAGMLNGISGDTVVIKIVSPTILHKSDVGGVLIVDKTYEAVQSALARMYAEIPDNFAGIIRKQPGLAPKTYRKLEGENLVAAIAKDIQGVVLCQYMPPDSEQFGNELLVSLRRTREFGMILSAGLGGTDTELYAERFRKGQAVVAAATAMVSGEQFFDLFKNTISYKKLAGLTRGGKRIVTDAQLLECFSAFIEVGNTYSTASPETKVIIEELEINPFAFSNFKMLPLDGLCRFSRAVQQLEPRPIEKIDRLLHPATIGIAGISARGINIGRIILDNIIKNGFDRDRLVLIHPEAAVIEGIATVADLSAIKEKVDLLILAVNAALIPGMIDMILERGLAESVILIPGGLGEKKGQEQVLAHIREKIAASRRDAGKKTIFLGGNSLGVLSHPGRYDSMFIPESKLPKDRSRHRRKSVLVSQSGGYMIARMSKLAFLDPAYAISIGNQIDLTAADFLKYFKSMEDIKTIAYYMEGFSDLDGLEFAKAVRETVPTGKEIIFYKAGRTQEGKTAMSGHTASIAGNYMVCESCISQAGAMVAETFTVFEGLLRLSCALHDKTVSGNRLAAVSNAGYESVGIADNILGEDYRLEMASLGRATKTVLAGILAGANLAEITDVNNPLDITPMASEDVYERVIAALLADPGVDAVIVAIVPLTPLLHTLPDEFVSTGTFSADQSIINRIARLNDHSAKPLVMVVDSGMLYDYMADAFQQQGLPVFRSADQAVWVLGKYIQGRLKRTHL